MASSAMKVLLVALAMVATAAIVRAAEEPPRADASHAHYKTFALWVLPGTVRFGNDSTAKLGDTGGNIRPLAETDGGPQVATMYQSAIYVDVTTTEKKLNFQGTIVLNEGDHFPAGKIFFVGDGSGIQASTSLDKSIVGGTGPYTHAEGKITRDAPGPYVITIFNW